MTIRIATTAEFPTPCLRASALVFALRRAGDGERAGRAVVCADARYVSVALVGESRLGRRFATVSEWQAIEAEIATLSAGATLPSDSTTARVVAADLGTALVLRLERAEAIEATPGELVGALDGLARQR